MKTFRIAGIDYSVMELPTDQMGGAIGLADFNKQEILINRDHTAATKRIALVHETLHILDKAYNLGLTEEQVVYTAHALVAFAVDNPHAEVFND